jgi:hypothetical protein
MHQWYAVAGILQLLTRTSIIHSFRCRCVGISSLLSVADSYRSLVGHHSALIVFKLERERPAFAVHQDTLYYTRDKYIRAYDINMYTGSDIGLLGVRKFGSPYVPLRTLSFNPAENTIILTISSDNGLYELTNLPTQSHTRPCE